MINNETLMITQIDQHVDEVENIEDKSGLRLLASGLPNKKFFLTIVLCPYIDIIRGNVGRCVGYDDVSMYQAVVEVSSQTYL